MNPLVYIKEVMRGKDMYRILMNRECREHRLFGTVLDLGSGTQKASYYRFLRQADDVSITTLDVAFGSGEQGEHRERHHVDFESDKLPVSNEHADTILLFNLLEHIYNYDFFLSEVQRVLKTGGTCIGVVPFLIGYHPDPHDFWRYTSETLRTIFTDAGFKNISIQPLGYGPFVAGLQQVESVMPRILKLFFGPVAWLLDSIIFRLRPHMPREHFSLGLFFTVQK